MLKADGKRASGFTLVELLIVAAIIAILAAIATPNFLLAQTRSKVARAKADLRAIASGVEMYRSDQNRYPPARTYCAGMQANQDEHNILPPELTSPVPYLSNRYCDVFNGGGREGRRYKYIAPGFGWSNEVQTILALWIPRDFPLDGGPSTDIPYFDEQSAPAKWALWSVGPIGPMSFWDSDASHLPVPPRTWYDPTNGTMSAGVVTRLSNDMMSP
ncbi:MAG: prepilin-type N-terminal cleavage/methylation domain-containing protein [bacterium]